MSPPCSAPGNPCSTFCSGNLISPLESSHQWCLIAFVFFWELKLLSMNYKGPITSPSRLISQNVRLSLGSCSCDCSHACYGCAFAPVVPSWVAFAVWPLLMASSRLIVDSTRLGSCLCWILSISPHRHLVWVPLLSGTVLNSSLHLPYCRVKYNSHQPESVP